MRDAVDFVNDWLQTAYQPLSPDYAHEVETIIVREHEGQYLFEILVRALFLIPAVYVFLISDCPRLDSSSLFLLHRTSRREWVTGQLLFFALTALAFSLLIFLCAVLPNSMDAFAANGWSTVVTKYAV